MKNLLTFLYILFALSAMAQTVKEKRYTYDDQNRLESIQYGNGAVVIFEYDKLGNRLKRLVTPASISNSMQINVLGSLVSGATLQRKRLGTTDYETIGHTDEQGILHAVFVPALVARDSLKLTAAGYQTLPIGVDAELAQNPHIFVPMAKASSSQIINPYLKLLNDGVVTTQPTLSLEMHGQNVTHYALEQDSVFVSATLVNQQMSVNLVRGYNPIKVRLIAESATDQGADTVVLEKGVYYYPATEINEQAFQVTLQVPETHLGAILYDFNVPIKRLTNPTETIWLLNGFHQLRLSQLGYQDAYFNCKTAATYDVKLNEQTFAACSTRFDFARQTVHYLGNSSVSVNQNATGQNTTVNFAKMQANLDSVRLLPVSPLYDLRWQNGGTTNYRLNGCFDQLNYPARAETYLGIWQNGQLTKILPENFAAAGIKYDSTYQLLQIANLHGAESQVVMLQRQPPIAQGADTVMVQQGQVSHWRATQLFIDPDSIKNDLRILRATSDNPLVQFSYTDSSLVIHSSDCNTGTFTLTVTATHDGLTETRNLTLETVSALERPTISFSDNKVSERIAQAETTIENARFQWYINGQAVANATDSIFKLDNSHQKSLIQVRVFDANGCSALSDMIVGVEQEIIIDNLVKIFPNPLNGSKKLNLEILQNGWIGKNLEVRILNASGQQLFNESFKYSGAPQKLDLAKLSSGAYVIKIVLGNQALTTKKLIIK